MDADDVKKLLGDIREGRVELEGTTKEKIIKEIISVERKHLYGLDSTSPAKRRDEVEKIVLKYFLKSEEQIGEQG